MGGNADPGLTLIVAAIGGTATLLGAVVGWVLQLISSHRQREWMVDDRTVQHDHDLAVRRMELGEARFLRLWSERREVYTRVLNGYEEYVAAIQDLRDAGVPSGIDVSSSYDVANADPISARALVAMQTQRGILSDVVLVADHEVRESVVLLTNLLRDAFRAAIVGEDGLAAVRQQHGRVLTSMRKELVGDPIRAPREYRDPDL